MKHGKLRMFALMLIVALLSGCAATMDPIENYKDPAFKNLEICIDLDACTAPKTAGDCTITYRPVTEDHEIFIHAFLDGQVTEQETHALGTTYFNNKKVLLLESDIIHHVGKEIPNPSTGFSFSVSGEAASLSEAHLFQTLDSSAYCRQLLYGLNGSEFDFKPIAEVIEETDQILAEIGLSDMELCFYSAYSAETIKQLEMLIGNRGEEERPGEQPKEDQYLLIYEKEASEQIASRLYVTYGKQGITGALLEDFIEEITFENTYTPCTAYEAVVALAEKLPNSSAQVISAEFWPQYNVWKVLLRKEVVGDQGKNYYNFSSYCVDARTVKITDIEALRNRLNMVQKEIFEKYKPDNVVYEAQ